MTETRLTKANRIKAAKARKKSFLNRLEKLRWHILRSFMIVLVFATGAFLARHFIFDVIILAPKSSDFITNRFLCSIAEFISMDALCIDNMNLEIINLKMSGQFLMHIYISIITGIIGSIPYILAEIWSSVMPLLYPKEKKNSVGVIAITYFLFMMGLLFSYFLIVPLTVNFLGTYQVSETVQNTIALSSYIGTVVTLTFGVGLVFDMPVFAFFLTKAGILTPQFMKKNRKFMLVIILALSAIITPGDVFSQVLVSIPLLGLYEFSIIISRHLYNKQMEEDAPEAL